MTAFSLLLVLALALLGAIALYGARESAAASRRLRELAHARAALSERLVERARVLDSKQRLEEAQRTAEVAIDVGNTSVREMHQAIAGIPFGVLEQVPVTRDVSRVVREVHDTAAKGVYDAIERVNKLAGRGLRGRIHRPEQVERPEQAEPEPDA